MKIRLLKKLIGIEDGYNLHYTRPSEFGARRGQTGAKGYICAGSLLCSDLISLCVDKMKIAYALDTFDKGKECVLRDGDLPLKYWDAFERIIESGEIEQVINGDDDIDNPIEVYYYDYRTQRVALALTDELGYPNVTHEGILMHANDHWPDRVEAVEAAVISLSSNLNSAYRQRHEAIKNLSELEKRISRAMRSLSSIEPGIKVRDSICEKCGTPYFITLNRNWNCDACIEPIFSFESD